MLAIFMQSLLQSSRLMLATRRQCLQQKMTGSQTHRLLTLRMCMSGPKRPQFRQEAARIRHHESVTPSQLTLRARTASTQDILQKAYKCYTGLSGTGQK
eukprot:1318396-Amphidinium_carterae.1